MSGNVYTEDGGAPVASAVTELLKKTGDTYAQEGADDDGTFSFVGVPNGTYKVTATLAGCQGAETADFTVNDGNVSGLQLRVACDFVPVTPKRLLETRPSPFDTLPDTAVKNPGQAITKVRVREGTTGVPSDAPAVSLNVTGVESTGNDGFLTVWDCSDAIGGTDGFEPDPPLASNVNLSANDIRPNAAISKIGTGDNDDFVCIFSRNPTHLVVDLNGWFPAKAGTDEIDFAATPTRVLDTRPSGGGITQTGYVGGKPIANQIIKVDVGGATTADIINVTGVDGSGFVTLWDCADTKDDGGAGVEPDPPVVSALNLESGIISANLNITKNTAQGEVCLYTQNSAHLIMDLIGWFRPGSNYTAQAPVRVLETRPSPFNTEPDDAVKAVANGKIVVDLASKAPAGTTLKAVALNVTGTQSNQGYVTVYPCSSAADAPPLASNLNLVPNQSRPNLVLTKVGPTGKVCIFTQNATHLLADLVGVFPNHNPA